jgi:hypothetical protein
VRLEIRFVTGYAFRHTARCAPDIRFSGCGAYGSHGSPALFDVHIYDDTGDSFATAFNSLNAQGYQGVPWIIGEAVYNDATEAAALRQQATSTASKFFI